MTTLPPIFLGASGRHWEVRSRNLANCDRPPFATPVGDRSNDRLEKRGVAPPKEVGGQGGEPSLACAGLKSLHSPLITALGAVVVDRSPIA